MFVNISNVIGTTQTKLLSFLTHTSEALGFVSGAAA
jgi:hypothetical protein